ncbi:hypothetical protein M0802_011224 [Mischocyttarus mexicanus]|nr:hypothetical protein M0802_011224 [Mischocyttarus mexicanus]
MNRFNIIDPLPNKEPSDDRTGKTYRVRRRRRRRRKEEEEEEEVVEEEEEEGFYENVRFTVACLLPMEKKQDTKSLCRTK